MGVLLGFPAGQHTGLLLGLFFLDYRITIISATSFFHPGPDTIFIDLYKLRQYTILSVLLPTFFRVFFKKKKNPSNDFANCHVIGSHGKPEIINV